MALELHILLAGPDLHARDQWQAAIDDLRLPVALDPQLALPGTTGYRPCTVNGQGSGFEIHVDSPSELLKQYSALAAHASEAACAISFRWGGEAARQAAPDGTPP